MFRDCRQTQTNLHNKLWRLPNRVSPSQDLAAVSVEWIFHYEHQLNTFDTLASLLEHLVDLLKHIIAYGDRTQSLVSHFWRCPISLLCTGPLSCNESLIFWTWFRVFKLNPILTMVRQAAFLLNRLEIGQKVFVKLEKIGGKNSRLHQSILNIWLSPVSSRKLGSWKFLLELIPTSSRQNLLLSFGSYKCKSLLGRCKMPNQVRYSPGTRERYPQKGIKK